MTRNQDDKVFVRLIFQAFYRLIQIFLNHLPLLRCRLGAQGDPKYDKWIH